MQCKRSMGELEVPSPSPSGEGQLTSSRGRVVKPRTWEDNAEPPLALAGSRLQRTTTPNKEPQGSPEGDRPPLPAGRRPVSAGAVPLGLGLSMNMAKRGTVPVRDETGRFTGVRPKTAAERLQAANGGGGIFKTAAAEILRSERRLMSTGEIARLAMKRGLITCNGKTPDATMASALYTDLKRRDTNSIFIRPHEGLFGLREWTSEENGHFEGRTDSGHLYVMDPTDILSTGGRGFGLSPMPSGVIEAGGAGGDDDDATCSGLEGAVSPGSLGFLPLLPPRHLKRPRNAPARSAQTPAGLPNWGRSNLSRAASAGVVDGPVLKSEPVVRSRSMGKNGAGSEGENGNIMLLLDAAQELHRSSSGDEGADIEPSTAGTGGGAGKDDARSRKPGLRQAPAKSRKLQEPAAEDSVIHPPSPKNGEKRKRALSGASLAAAMANHPHVLFDDEGVGRSPRSVAAKARYANSSQQAIAARAEQQGLLIEGFNAQRLAREQAKLPNAGKGLHNEQVNILNLPMPDFDVSGDEPLVAIPEPYEAVAKGMSVSDEVAMAGDPAGSQAQSGESGSLPNHAAAAAKERSMLEWSRNQLLRLEESLVTMERQIGPTHPHLGQMHLTLGLAFQSASADPGNFQKAQLHLQKAKKIWEAHAPKAADGQSAGGEFHYLLSKAAKPSAGLPAPIAVAEPAGQPAWGLPSSLGVSPVPTPAVNPPLPYSLPTSQASKPHGQAGTVPMAAMQPPAWHSTAPPSVPGAMPAQANLPAQQSAAPMPAAPPAAPAAVATPAAGSAAAGSDAAPAMVQTSA